MCNSKTGQVDRNNTQAWPGFAWLGLVTTYIYNFLLAGELIDEKIFPVVDFCQRNVEFPIYLENI